MEISWYMKILCFVLPSRNVSGSVEIKTVKFPYWFVPPMCFDNFFRKLTPVLVLYNIQAV